MSLLYESESFKIRGAAFEVYKSLGCGHKEAVHQKAYYEALTKLGLKAEREKRLPVYFQGKQIGTYAPDFVVDDKIPVELKAKPQINSHDADQFWHYLTGTSYKLGFLINFGKPGGVEIIRRVYDTARNSIPLSSALDSAQFRVALVHDSFTQMGGAERVLDVLHEMFPDSTVYTLVFDRKYKGKYQTWNIQTTWLQYFYNLISKLQYWLFLIPWAVASIKIKDADVVISSSSGFVKNIKVPKNCIHINYCHTPTRFLWIDKDYINHEVPFLLKPLIKFFLKWMRKWDYAGAQRVHPHTKVFRRWLLGILPFRLSQRLSNRWHEGTYGVGVNHFIANSKEVQKRISDVYHRQSEIIYPPIDTDFWHSTAPKSDYFLAAGRLQAHKKIDFIIEIFNEIGLPLHVIGTGRQENYLRSLAKPNIKFFGRISDEQLRNEYSGALGFIYPQVEDFGLMPLEAAACDTPTLAYAQGGSLETVIPGITGELFDSFDVDEVKEIILNWNTEKYHKSAFEEHSRKYSLTNFKENILSFIENAHSN